MIPTTDVPAPIRQLLEQLDAPEMLTDYIPRARITRLVTWIDFSLFVREHGYRVDLEEGNVFGRIMLVPASAEPAPVLRIVTRNDVAAQYGSRAR